MHGSQHWTVSGQPRAAPPHLPTHVPDAPAACMCPSCLPACPTRTAQRKECKDCLALYSTATWELRARVQVGGLRAC
jgi:hypothetical protein